MEVDQERVLRYLQSKLPAVGLPSPSTIEVTRFKKGQSNPTFLIACSVERSAAVASRSKTFNLVLRKQPPGALLKGAHDVIREAHCIQHIANSKQLLVPRIYSIETDTGIVGTPFFLMEFIDGTIYRQPRLDNLCATHRTCIYASLAKTMANIHNSDLFPRGSHQESMTTTPKFCQRQINIWTAQYSKSVQEVSDLPDMLELKQWLSVNIPSSCDNGNGQDICSVLHGDFRLDNMVFDSKHDCIAVLDWELCSVGPPLADAAYACLGYYLPDSGFTSSFSLLNSNNDMNNKSSVPVGIPDVQTFLNEYLSHLFTEKCPKIDVHSKQWVYFLALGLYRIASICAGVYSRAVQGNASQGSQSLVFKDAVPLLAARAMELIQPYYTPKTTNEPSTGLGPSRLAQGLILKLRAFIDEVVLPQEAALTEHAQTATGTWPQRGNKWVPHPIVLSFQTEARRRGLWNLWLTQHTYEKLVKEHPRWPWTRLFPHRRGLSHLDYAHIAIETGRSLYGAEAVNCMAPDTGNMEILATFGSDKHRERFLLPLLQGTAKSCFGMTEPGVASSDPTQLQSTAVKDAQGQWIVNGRKWWTTGACDPRVMVCIFVARTSNDTSLPSHRRHSFFVVPMEEKGVTVVRPLTVLGYDDAPSGHAETSFENVSLSPDLLLGDEGKGFALAQSR